MVTIEKLIVKIGKKELNLTLEEAKELQTELNKTLGHVQYLPYIHWQELQAPRIYNTPYITSGFAKVQGLQSIGSNNI